MYYIDITNIIKYLSIKTTKIYKHMFIYTITSIYLINFDEGQKPENDSPYITCWPSYMMFLYLWQDVSWSVARCLLICGGIFLDLLQDVSWYVARFFLSVTRCLLICGKMFIVSEARSWYFNKMVLQDTLRSEIHVRKIVHEIVRVKQW